MSSASRDENRVPTVLGVSNADGKTPLPVYSSPTFHGLQTANVSGTMPVDNTAARDGNHVPSLVAASNVDGTPVVIGLDSLNHGLFIESH